MTSTEPLVTGWEQDGPRDDTLVRRFLHHWAATCEAFTAAAGARTIDDGRFVISDYRSPSGYFNAVVLQQPLTPETVDDTLDATSRRLDGGRGEVGLWSAWPTPDLSTYGWRLEGHPPLLTRPPASIAPPPQAPELDVRPVDGPTRLRGWERVAAEGYPMPETISRASPSGSRCGRPADSGSGSAMPSTDCWPPQTCG